MTGDARGAARGYVEYLRSGARSEKPDLWGAVDVKWGVGHIFVTAPFRVPVCESTTRVGPRDV